MYRSTWRQHYLLTRTNLARLCYDAVCAFAAFMLAALLRIAFEYIFQPEGKLDPDLGIESSWFFLKWSPAFVAITLLSFALVGMYPGKFRTDVEHRPFRMALGLSLPVTIWSLFMYYSADHPFFPRSVTLMSWVFLIVLCGVPRFVKHFVSQNMFLHLRSPKKENVTNVLVIGGAGYIGSQLCRDLLSRDFRVRVLDSNLFGDFAIRDLYAHKHFDCVVGDFRNVETVVSAMRNMDAVVHLGGIVGDPACALDDEFTIDVNLTATTMLAEVCKALRIPRFVFASTCSVYGEAKDTLLTEESSLNPVSLYARTKIASEQVLLGLQSKTFVPTILRFGTLFGLSPRPRFDLFVNLLTAKAVREGKMSVFGGSQWRPFVHVRDVSKAVIAVLEAPLSTVRGEIFNIGSDALNFQLEEVARRINKHIPSAKLTVEADKDDRRDYRVSFAKFVRMFGPILNTGIDEGILEMREAFVQGLIVDHLDPRYSNVRQTERALQSNADPNADGETVVWPQFRHTSQSILRQVAGA